MLNKEEYCLCAMLAAALTGNTAKNISAFSDGADMSKVVDMAEKHKVLSLLYSIFEGSGEDISPELMGRVQRFTEKTTLQSYRLLLLTKKITGLLEEQQISVIVLKGCGIAEKYPVPEYRKSGDVDLLLQDEEACGRAGKILERNGYRLKQEQHANHHVSFSDREGIDLELHLMMAEPFDSEGINVRMKEYQDRALSRPEKREVMGTVLPVAPEDVQAFSLLVHMLQHFLRAGFGLKLLTDWVAFWNRVEDETVRESYLKMTQECGIDGFSKAVTLVCEKYLGLQGGRIYREDLTKCFSEAFAERFLQDILEGEEFGESKAGRMVALRQSGIRGMLKEFHYQMKMNYPVESRSRLRWPGLWIRTFAVFLRNNRRLKRGSVRGILKNAKERAKVAEEMKLFGK